MPTPAENSHASVTSGTDGVSTVSERGGGLAATTDPRDGHAVASAGLSESVPAPARDVNEGAALVIVPRLARSS